MIQKISVTIYNPSEQDLHTLAAFVGTRQAELDAGEELPHAVERVDLSTEVFRAHATDDHGFIIPVYVEAVIERTPF